MKIEFDYEKSIYNDYLDNSLQIADIVKESMVDGPGLRTAIFLQGCENKCPGCHNQHTHDIAKGKPISLNEILQEIDSDRISTGITFTGGDPLYSYFNQYQSGFRYNWSNLLFLLQMLIINRSTDCILYTGYSLNEIFKSYYFWEFHHHPKNKCLKLTNYEDTLFTIQPEKEYHLRHDRELDFLLGNMSMIITDRYIEQCKSMSCAWRGSTNQQIYAVKRYPNRRGWLDVELMNVTEEMDQGIYDYEKHLENDLLIQPF